MSEFLSKKEVEKEYPLLTKYFGKNLVIERITCIGKSSAHMIFAPLLETHLQAEVKAKLVDTFELRIRRKPRKR